MLNRTNRTLSATLNRLNLGTRSLALVAGVNNGITLRIRHGHPFMDLQRVGTWDDRDIAMYWAMASISPSIPSSPCASAVPAYSRPESGPWPVADASVCVEAPPEAREVVVRDVPPGSTGRPVTQSKSRQGSQTWAARSKRVANAAERSGLTGTPAATVRTARLAAALPAPRG